MRCLACNCNLTDREASRQYVDTTEIKNPEDKYIGLCDDCIRDTGLDYIENPLTSKEPVQDEDYGHDENPELLT